MTLMQSHNYTINLDNVDYFRSHTCDDLSEETVFKMNNGRTVQITCPYDDVISQLRGSMNIMNGTTIKKIITLDY